MQPVTDSARTPLASELFVKSQAVYRLENWYSVKKYFWKFQAEL